MNKQITTHRLICEDCLNVIAHVSYLKGEREFMNNLGTLRCPQCDDKISNKERLP